MAVETVGWTVREFEPGRYGATATGAGGVLLKGCRLPIKNMPPRAPVVFKGSEGEAVSLDLGTKESAGDSVTDLS